MAMEVDTPPARLSRIVAVNAEVSAPASAGGATLADLQMEWRPLVSPASMSSPAAASTSSDRRLVDLSEQGLDNAEEGVATVMEALLKA